MCLLLKLPRPRSDCCTMTAITVTLKTACMCSFLMGMCGFRNIKYYSHKRFPQQINEKHTIHSLVMIVAGEVTVQLEKAVLKSSFSRLGGLQLDREVKLVSKKKQPTK